MTPEAAVKNQVKRLLDAAGAYYFLPPGSGYGRAGIPDIIACVNGYFLAIECKAGRGKTTALQDRELDAVRATGGQALVISDGHADMLRLCDAVHALQQRKYT